MARWQYPGIQYPEAYVEPFQRVHITDAHAGLTYFCYGCRQEMVRRQGSKRRWHFAHKAEFDRCEGDNALHEAAKANIVEGFLSAMESGDDYNLGYLCQGCGVHILVNVAEQGAGIATERIAVEGTRSDLVVINPISKIRQRGRVERVIIEIVVSHDLEVDTHLKYQDAGTPVIKVKPTWETLDELRPSCIGYDTLNIDKKRCPECEEIERRRGEAEEKLKAEVEEAGQAEMEKHEKLSEIARELLLGVRPHTGRRIQLKPITHDKFGSPLRRETRRQVNDYARRLEWLGFEQQASRATLLMYRSGGWKIYADLGGTEILRIWEVECVPAIYAFPDNDRVPHSALHGHLLEQLGSVLESHGVPVRRHFEDSE